MSTDVSPFARILELSAFDGDSSSALVALHAHLGALLPGCSTALIQVEGYAPGTCRIAGWIDAGGNERIANRDPRGEHTRAPLFSDAASIALFVGAVEARVLVVDAMLAAAPLLRALGDPRAVLGVPLASTGQVTHWLAFCADVPTRFDTLDRDAFVIEANLATSLIVRPLATRALREETTRQRNAIEGLADVQRLLLPDNPRILGLDYAVHWQPAETAAGDYYDLVNLDGYAPEGFAHDRYAMWVVTLADVSGHGAAAAMEAAQFDAILRTYHGGEEAGPAGALTYANRYFFSRRQRHHFLTAIALLYRPDLGRATYVNAGHPPLLHRRGDLVIAHGEAEQIPLGILRDQVFENHSFDIVSGDLLVLYTDGIVETRDAEQRPFGGERLRELVASGPLDAHAMLALLRDAVIAHQGSPLGVDDQTLIVLRVAHDA